MQPVNLRGYQASCIRELYHGFSKKNLRRQLLVAATGAGKCLAAGTKVLMADGTLRSVECLRVGDLLEGDDGTPRRIMSLGHGTGLLFRVTPKNGLPFVCNSVHMLTFKWLGTGRKGRGWVNGQLVDIPLNEYVGMNAGLRNNLYSVKVAVDYPKREVPIDPYDLGYWMGRPSHSTDRARAYSRERHRWLWHESIKWRLKMTDSQDKRVPDLYMVNDRETRLQFIAGLIDRKGYVSNEAGVNIRYRHEEMACSIARLMRSVGLCVSHRPYTENDKPVVVLWISGDLSQIPTRKKKMPSRAPRYDLSISSIEIETAFHGSYFGFTLDGNGRFLLEDFTVTHNTVIMSQVIQHAAQRNRRCMVIVHRDPLVRQTFDKLRSFGVTPGVIKAGVPEDRTNPIQVASIGSLIRRRWINDGWLDGAMLLIDEAHVNAWSGWIKGVLDRSANCRMIGFTGTPWRLKRTEGMLDVFEEGVFAPTPSELMQMGYLVNGEYWYFGKSMQEGVNTVRTVRGDYHSRELGIVCNKPELIVEMAEHWKQKAMGRRTLVFCVNVAHSLEYTRLWNELGIRTRHIDGSTPNTRTNPLRQQLYDALADHTIDAITSCAALDIGLDIPEVECIVHSRPTKSKATWFQGIGRGARVADWIGKKNMLVLDQTRNSVTHGAIEDLTRADFELTKGGDPPLIPQDAPRKLCPRCNHVMQASIMKCMQCGHQFQAARKIEMTGEMAQLEVRKTLATDVRKKYYDSWAKNAYHKGYSPGQAMVQYKQRFGAYPSSEIMLGAIFGGHSNQMCQERYLNYLEQVAIKKKKDQQWVARMFKFEFGFGL